MLKVKRVSYEFVDDQKIVQMLENESQKGWDLAFMNSSYYFFKSSKQPHHYYVDFNYRSQEYDETLKQMGYEFVGNAYKMRVYRSVEQLEPLQSDPVVMGNALLEMFGLWRGIGAIIGAAYFYFLTRIVSNFRFNTFNIQLHTDSILIHVLGILCSLVFLFFGVELLEKRRVIQKQMDGEMPSFKVLHGLNICIIISLILTLISLIMVAFCCTKTGWRILWSLLIILIGICIFDFVYQKYVMSNQQKAIRFLGTLAFVIMITVVRMNLFPNNENLDELIKYTEIPSFSKMVISKEFDGPFADVQYSDNDQHHEVAVIRHLKQPETIVEGFKSRSLYWKEEMSHNTYYFLMSEKMAWIDGYGSKFHENQIDTASYQKIENDKVDQMWHSGEFWILQKDDMVIFARCQESQVDGLLEMFVE